MSSCTSHLCLIEKQLGWKVAAYQELITTFPANLQRAPSVGQSYTHIYTHTQIKRYGMYWFCKMTYSKEESVPLEGSVRHLNKPKQMAWQGKPSVSCQQHPACACSCSTLKHRAQRLRAPAAAFRRDQGIIPLPQGARQVVSPAPDRRN